MPTLILIKVYVCIFNYYLFKAARRLVSAHLQLQQNFGKIFMATKLITNITLWQKKFFGFHWTQTRNYICVWKTVKDRWN